MERVDVTVIGAGVIGLAIAAEIVKPGLNVYILEKMWIMAEESVPVTVK